MNILAIKLDDHAVDVSFTKTSLHFVLAKSQLHWNGFQYYAMELMLNDKSGVALVMALEYIGLRLMRISQSVL